MLDFIGNDIGNLKNYVLCAKQSCICNCIIQLYEVLHLVHQEKCVRAGKHPENGN